jgi:hypothetical protein
MTQSKWGESSYKSRAYGGWQWLGVKELSGELNVPVHRVLETWLWAPCVLSVSAQSAATKTTR